MLSGLPERAWTRVRQAWVRIALDGATAVVAFVVAQLVLREPAPIFAPIAAVVGDRVVAGTIDRLVIEPERVRIVDYKTARRPPATIATRSHSASASSR